jgi:putative transposase
MEGAPGVHQPPARVASKRGEPVARINAHIRVDTQRPACDADPVSSNEEHTAPHRKEMRRREFLCSWRFLTFSCVDRLPLLGNAGIRNAFVDSLRVARERHRFRLLAWVVMPEHVHMIIVPRPILDFDGGLPVVASRSDVSTIMWGLKKPFAQRVLARWRKLGAPVLQRLAMPDGTHQFWLPGGGFDRNVRTDEEAWREICYTHENPVRRGLVARAEEWAWSSARWYAGQKQGEIPIDNDHDRMAWIPPPEWVRDAIRLSPDEV